AFAADVAKGWAELRRTPAHARRVALVLANYPNRDSRLGNGVGLDTPQSVLTILEAMAAEGYAVADLPADSAALMDRLRAGVTNARRMGEGGPVLALGDYQAAFASLAPEVRE